MTNSLRFIQWNGCSSSRRMASTLRGGQKALEILASVPVHIIASDMKLPGIDGLTLLMTVKEKYQDVIRLVLSGYTQTAQLLPCINRGEIFRFITKPLSVDELITSIKDVIELVELRAVKKTNSPKRCKGKTNYFYG